jgi:hypothetical protein
MKTYNFTLKRRSKKINKEMPLIFGISGVARCGKDTFANHLEHKLNKNKYPVTKISFASAVKNDLDFFLKEKLNISAFTSKTSEKEIIRPLLVTYATDVVRNKIDKDFWINKINERVLSCVNADEPIIVLIPDVRYDNEVKWIKKLGGYIIHIQRSGNKPANFEEKVNDPIVKKLADYKIKWNTFTNEKETCSYYIAKMFKENNWSIYGEFK